MGIMQEWLTSSPSFYIYCDKSIDELPFDTQETSFTKPQKFLWTTQDCIKLWISVPGAKALHDLFQFSMANMCLDLSCCLWFSLFSVKRFFWLHTAWLYTVPSACWYFLHIQLFGHAIVMALGMAMSVGQFVGLSTTLVQTENKNCRMICHEIPEPKSYWPFRKMQQLWLWMDCHDIWFIHSCPPSGGINNFGELLTFLSSVVVRSTFQFIPAKLLPISHSCTSAC